MPKFNLNWMYMIIALMLLGLWWGSDSKGAGSKAVTYSEFQDYVKKGYVSKVLGYEDKSIEAFLKPTAVGAVFGADSTKVGRNPVITSRTPSTDKLEEFLQAEKEAGHFDGSSDYPPKSDIFPAILIQVLPLVLLVALWIFFMRRMSGGGSGGPGGVFNVGKSKAQLFEKGGAIKITFKDVAGLLVPENGELKADTHKEETLPQRKLDTYGRQFSMSRQAFINDDIGFLSEVPGMYAAKSKKQINKMIYSILYNNGQIYDGKTLFHANHKNLITSGSAPTGAAIQAMIQRMQLQDDPFGEAINLTPSTIILPVGYGFAMQSIFGSPTIQTSENTQAANPLYNYRYPMEIVEDATLNILAGSGACPWFLGANREETTGIQVDYLNGQETPTFRRSETVGQLGFVWDIWLDWGISVMDYRAFVKNPGAALPTL